MGNCQYTGIELENKRAKNHPEVTALLADANKKGVYGDVVSAMSRAKRDGITGLAVIEIGRYALKSGLQAATEFSDKLRADRKERQNVESARIAEYRANGPTHKDEEDLDLEAQEEVRRQDARYQSRKDQYQNQFEPMHGIEG